MERNECEIANESLLKPQAEEIARFEVVGEESVVHRKLTTVGSVVLEKMVRREKVATEDSASEESYSVTRVPVGRAVAEREPPHEVDGTIVVPVYEERLVTSTQLFLKE